MFWNIWTVLEASITQSHWGVVRTLGCDPQASKHTCLEYFRLTLPYLCIRAVHIKCGQRSHSSCLPRITHSHSDKGGTNDSNASRPSPTNKPKCHYCGNSGHLKYECGKLKRDQQSNSAGTKYVACTCASACDSTLGGYTSCTIAVRVIRP
jgi:hypothetical protein